jgi:hypothetical protein
VRVPSRLPTVVTAAIVDFIMLTVEAAGAPRRGHQQLEKHQLMAGGAHPPPSLLQLIACEWPGGQSPTRRQGARSHHNCVEAVHGIDPLALGVHEAHPPDGEGGDDLYE